MVLPALPALRRLSSAAAWAWLAACASMPGARPVAAARSVAPAPEGARPCVVPDSLLTRRDTLWLHAMILDPGGRALTPQADLLAQRVASRLRLLLGGNGDSLPRGEPAVSWQTDATGNLAVMAHRDGRVTWRELLPMPTRDTVATHLLARALDSVVAHRETVTWTIEAVRDSVPIRLGLSSSAEPLTPRLLGPGFPVLLLRAPVEERPTLISHGPIRYPEDQKYALVNAHLLMEMVVDTLGRPEIQSIRDAAPLDTPRATPQELQDHQAFVAAARATLTGSRYTPGRIGGCAVRVRVEIPLNFTIVGPGRSPP